MHALFGLALGVAAVACWALVYWLTYRLWTGEWW